MKVIFLVGPTATGKSKLALKMSRKYDAEIINADSIQFFKSVNIGSCKPSTEELHMVPHHLFDIIDEGEDFTAGEFRRLCLKKLSEIPSKYVFIVGGSGFYINALIFGMYESPKTPRELKVKLDQDLAQNGLQLIYNEVKRKDPEYAAKINQNDKYRILRAASIMRLQDSTITEIQASYIKEQFPYQHVFLQIDMDRANIKKNVIARTKQMLERGLIDEVKALLNKDLKDWTPMKSVGYREVVKFIENDITYDELQDEIVKSTMQLVKKQSTWFNRYRGVKVKHNDSMNLDSFFSKGLKQ